MRWFNHPTPDQIAFLNEHVGQKVVEPFCGPEPLFDLCENLSWAIGVDKESFDHLSQVRDRKDIHRTLIQRWIKDHKEEWASADTVIMCYPPNANIDRADAKVLHAMHLGQKLVLAIPRPWCNSVVAGSYAFWDYLFDHFWLYATSTMSGSNTKGNSDVIYVLGKQQLEDSKPSRSLLEGHELFQYEGWRESSRVMAENGQSTLFPSRKHPKE